MVSGSFGEWRELERLELEAQLILRFHDVALERAVTESLQVRVRIGQSGQRITLPRSPSGAYVLCHRWLELATSNHAVPATVTVSDVAGRFLPILVNASLPADRLEWSGAGTGVPIPLFSSIRRQLPPGCGRLIAQLVREDDGRPAMGALVRVTVEGESHLGLVDTTGQVMVAVPPRVDDSVEPPAALSALVEVFFDDAALLQAGHFLVEDALLQDSPWRFVLASSVEPSLSTPFAWGAPVIVRRSGATGDVPIPIRPSV